MVRKIFVIVSTIVIISSLVTLSACRQSAPTPPTKDETELAKSLVEHLVLAQYSDVVKMFTRDLRSKLPVSALKTGWESTTARLGTFREQQPGVKQTTGEHVVVAVSTAFTKGSVRVRVTFNRSKEVAGLFLDNVQIMTMYQTPAYVNTNAFHEEAVTVGIGEWALPGTLSLPTHKTDLIPAVVLVHGSGPHDRDETVFDNKPFKDLAHGLASRGIAVVRYEKRTKEHGARMQSERVTPYEETVEDAVHALRLLLSDPRIDQNRIYVLGHSLGGTLAPQIASLEPRVAGLILLAGAARPLEDLVLEQMEYLYNLDGTLTSIEQQHLKEVRAQVARVKDPKLSVKTRKELLPLAIPAIYWLYLREYNAIDTASEMQKPMLVLQGERDYQVTMKDFSLWRSIGKQVQAISYPTLNHLFMSGQGAPNPAEYEQPGNVDAVVIEDIATWIIGVPKFPK